MAARSRAILAPVAVLALMAFWGSSFVAAPSQPLRSQQALLAGSVAMAPAAAQALPEGLDLDLGSSVSMAGTIEIMMLGIVMGTVPVTFLGLMVAAWLQFKKGPTLGI
mmetsp:Transcript_12257/g.21770  ORF Transcript_12257/g.21770 Transcript_12257/m.21770 type:complete len:108 (+) Transcript_12257:55-378(+)